MRWVARAGFAALVTAALALAYVARVDIAEKPLFVTSHHPRVLVFVAGAILTGLLIIGAIVVVATAFYQTWKHGWGGDSA